MIKAIFERLMGRGVAVAGQATERRNVCGVDCHYGHDNCNYYCCGDASLPMIQKESE